jgi:hypothetical protein
MSHPPPTPSALDHFEAALEASCETLITLQLMRALVIEPSENVAHLEAETNRAITSLRRAIVELRLASGEEPGLLPVGFVLGRDQADDSDVAFPATYSRPRRTA